MVAVAGLHWRPPDPGEERHTADPGERGGCGPERRQGGVEFFLGAEARQQRSTGDRQRADPERQLQGQGQGPVLPAPQLPLLDAACHQEQRCLGEPMGQGHRAARHGRQHHQPHLRHRAPGQKPFQICGRQGLPDSEHRAAESDHAQQRQQGGVHCRQMQQGGSPTGDHHARQQC